METILHEKKIVIVAGKDEILSLTDVGNGEIYIQRIEKPKAKRKTAYVRLSKKKAN